MRFAVFLAFAQCGPMFSGLLAYAIVGMDGTAGYAGWRWIFILEGIVTIALSSLMFLFVPGFPQESKFLTDEERSRLLLRLEADRGDEKTDVAKVNWWKVFTDYKIWLL